MKKIVTDILNDKYIKKSRLEKVNSYDEEITIREDNIINTWMGMGSAITESAAYNYHLLNKLHRIKFIRDYYGKNGLSLDLGRIAIGSSDFSLSSYEYIDRSLSSFSIARDKEYVIPMLKDIKKIKNISLIASPWSPPAYMKTNYSLTFGGKLKKKYYEDYANYLSMFINEYKKEGFNIDYLTIQNEPSAMQIWESCIFNPRDSKRFIKKNLLDKLEDTKILLWDHNREKLDKVVKKYYIDDPKVVGIAMHWYTGNHFDKIKKVHEKYPNLLIINSEMCCGFSKYSESKWINDAEIYLYDIIGSINNGTSAYLDFNVLLDYNGGPNHKKNYVKAPSILKKDKSGYIKSPIYYYLYHVSHFIPKGSIILENISSDNIDVVSARNGKDIIITILNKGSRAIKFKINNSKESIVDKIDAHSIITYII